VGGPAPPGGHTPQRTYGAESPSPPKEGGGGRPGRPEGRVKVGVKGGACPSREGDAVGPFLGNLQSRGELRAQLYLYGWARRHEVDGYRNALAALCRAGRVSSSPSNLQNSIMCFFVGQNICRGITPPDMLKT